MHIPIVQVALHNMRHRRRREDKIVFYTLRVVYGYTFVSCANVREVQLVTHPRHWTTAVQLYNKYKLIL